MQLSNIKEYLEKYRDKLSLEDEKRDQLLNIIQNEAGILLSKDSLVVTKGIITIRSSTVVKNELFLHKIKILQKIKEEGRTDIFDLT